MLLQASPLQAVLTLTCRGLRRVCVPAVRFVGKAQKRKRLQAMRAVLKRKASVHLIEKNVLLQAFAAVLKTRRVSAKDTVRLEQFQAVWKALNVSVSEKEAVAIFNKYGQV